jgi:uncharacterized membrane protein
MVVLGAALLHWLPLWRRQGLWFGVTVAPGFASSPDGRRALGRYRAAMWGLSLVAIACVAAGARLGVPWLMPAGVLGQVLGASVAFAVVRRGIRPHAVRASGVRSADLSVSAEGLPGGAASVLVPIGLLAATAVYLRANWLRLPERLPVHWGLDGAPDRWADRTWAHVYGPLLICALIAAFQLALAEVIIHRSPRGRIAGTEAWTTRFRRANLVVLVAGVWGVSAMLCAFSLMPLFAPAGGPSALVWIMPVVLVVSIAPFVWQLIRLTQDRSSGSDGTPDECWKFGLIYFNPNDPAIMVEKRFGVGYTLNFGNRALVWILGAGLLIAVLVRAVS